ncbi:hypothetical protein G7015_03240 [Pseudomonas kunmingensis]|nr:hypothetical protein [Stutzerimonas kunmingensis]MBA1237498.1 hypothetical protein [Stutzerimonas kunmingensis]
MHANAATMFCRSPTNNACHYPITHQITALSIIGWMVADPIQGKYGVI